MHTRTLSFAFLALVTSQVAGNTLSVRSTTDNLSARQLGIPTAAAFVEPAADCAAQCDVPLHAVTTCEGDEDCLCSENTHSTYGECMNCALARPGSGEEDLAAAQRAISKYEDACNSSGHNLQPIVVALGGSGNSTGSGEASSGGGEPEPTETSGSNGDNGAGVLAMSSGAIVGLVGVSIAVLSF
ncbi:hypothetical protein C8Q76DRAFT_694749 [Earliella scabrosa]|nr:hypothetical protein C8Q76DRAFT_694749 [Earliella scabrosa]